MATRKKPSTTMLTARVPVSIVKALDKAAARADRSRSAEVLQRLKESLKAPPQGSAT